jgi:hypothetical protein
LLTEDLENPNKKFFKLNENDYDFDGMRVLINRIVGNQYDEDFDDDELEDLYFEFRVFFEFIF